MHDNVGVGVGEGLAKHVSLRNFAWDVACVTWHAASEKGVGSRTRGYADGCGLHTKWTAGRAIIISNVFIDLRERTPDHVHLGDLA